MSHIIMTVDNLEIVLDPSGIEVSHDFSFRLAEGEILGLVGESGCGKTTVATSLLNYQRRGAKIAGGTVEIDGTQILTLDNRQLRRMRGGVISYVPQDPGSALNPALRIGKQLIEILEEHGFGAAQAERHERMREMLNEVMLPTNPEFLKRYPHQLSGGQQQRIVLAMAFACRPKVIVLDEPTTGLDVTTQWHVLDTIRDLTRVHRAAAVYVTHDLAVVASLADRIAVMYAGNLVEIGPCRELFEEPGHPYTRRLLAAIPVLKGRRSLQGIPGFAPPPGRRPVGCGFGPRCYRAIDRCRTEAPPENSVSDSHCVRCWQRADVVAEAPISADADLVVEAGEQRELLAVKGVRAWYGSQEVVHNVDVVLRPRECLALVGESGSGKTTLARCIAGLHSFRMEGEMQFEGKRLPRSSRHRSVPMRRAIQYVFQNPYLSLHPRKTIAQIIVQPINVFFNPTAAEREERLQQLLGLVSLDASILGRYPADLSGGERQRVAIARALAAEPTLLVCDEVTSWLDVSVQAMIIGLLAGLKSEMGLSLLFVTHNLAVIRSIAYEVAVMSEGRIVEYGRVDDVLGEPKMDYTKELLANTPTIEVKMGG